MEVVVETPRLSKTSKDERRSQDKVSENSSTWKMRGEINEGRGELEDKKKRDF